MATRKGAKKTAAKRATADRSIQTTRPARAKKTSDKPKRNTTDTASKGKGTAPVKQKSNRRETIHTMPSVHMGTQPTGKQLKGEEPMEDEDDLGEGNRNKRLSEETVNRLGRAELRAIAITRGYWEPRGTENRSGTRVTRTGFLEAQAKDKSLKGTV